MLILLLRRLAAWHLFLPPVQKTKKWGQWSRCVFSIWLFGLIYPPLEHSWEFANVWNKTFSLYMLVTRIKPSRSFHEFLRLRGAPSQVKPGILFKCDPPPPKNQPTKPTAWTQVWMCIVGSVSVEPVLILDRCWLCKLLWTQRLQNSLKKLIGASLVVLPCREIKV